MELFADMILPVAVKGRFTYRVPADLVPQASQGKIARVQFGSSKKYTGVIAAVHHNPPAEGKSRDIISVSAIHEVSTVQLKLWKWISEYYMCSEGEVMKAAIPSDKSIEGWSPRMESFIELAHDFTEEEMNVILDSLRKAPKQLEALMEWLRISSFPAQSNARVKKAELLSGLHLSPAVLEALSHKDIIRQVQEPVSRTGFAGDNLQPPNPLSKAQQDAIGSIREQFREKDIVLLHGITSSGKTEIYIHLIEEQLKLGKQVLYMLPEIALTTQIIQRLRKHFGSVTGVYHSRCTDAERLEIWMRVAGRDMESGCRLILGVRSSVFLPFSDLGLVIVDEEHDGSYKQQDPAPRYHSRDTAIMLARLHGCKTLLGSASPSIESYHNAVSGKYGLAELNERFGLINLPEIVIANTREARKRKLMVSHFTPELLYSMDEALGKKEQIILFQNRRGFSPYLECPECGWVPNCVQCAVSLTYHKGINRLVCHHCGYQDNVPHSCSSCGSPGLQTKGFGTEKIEDEIKIVFPAARVARMDQDTTRKKSSFDRLIRAFEEREIDILIGTQMISKGLDFENLTIVGVMNADSLLNFPDFRAHERGFQMLEQVSGRAGRRQKRGKVIIQTSDPGHRIIRQVVRHDYTGMFRTQAEERKAFGYPPFSRMVRIILKHRDRGQLVNFAESLGKSLKEVFGRRVLGPEEPLVSRVQLWYIRTILLKIEKEKPAAAARRMIDESISALEKQKGASSLRIAVDVDPY